MKNKLTAIILAAVLLLAACGPAAEVSETPDASAPANTSTPAHENSVPAENSTPVDNESTPATENSSSDEDSLPEENSKPNGGNTVAGGDPYVDGIYTGQDLDTHGVDRNDLEDFLEDSLFVGDSVTDGFKLYVNNYGDMPAVNFFSGASYGYQSACKDKASTSVHPKIGGEAKYIWEAVEHYEAKRVFICFGLNDFGYVSDSKLTTCLETICKNISEVSPETEVVFLSCGFFTKGGQTTSYGFSNDQVRAKNEIVLNFCDENGYDFIDVSWVYADADGNLKSEYSYDDYCHLSYDKYNFWEDILMAYAADKILGQYQNIETMLKK